MHTRAISSLLAAPRLKANLGVIEFWMDDGTESEVSGCAPYFSLSGQAQLIPAEECAIHECPRIALVACKPS